jgi:dienelactone hydrolase
VAIVSQTIEYRDCEQSLIGMLFSDSARGKMPGLLLVHHGGGLDDHSMTHSQHLAGEGFIVFACDMYGREIVGNRERILALLGDLRRDPKRLCRRAEAGLDVLKAQPSVDGRFAAIGYCFGGMTVLEMARAGAPLAGVACVHGSLATACLAAPGAVQAKILVCHGASDPHVPMTQVKAFAEEMSRAGADWQLVLYGGAMHGFTQKNVATTPGVAYNEAADLRSTVVIRGFLREIFGL